MINKATHRIRNTRGASYLTHGNDTYDHKGLKKARRMMDKAIIAEHLDETEVELEPTGPVQFRLVIRTQVYENYGAHTWDGNGTCPQHWKAKGGNEYHRLIGDANAVIALGKKGLNKLIKELEAKCTQSNESWDEYIIDASVYSTAEETPDERDYREMFEEGYYDYTGNPRKVYEDRLASLKV